MKRFIGVVLITIFLTFFIMQPLEDKNKYFIYAYKSNYTEAEHLGRIYNIVKKTYRLTDHDKVQVEMLYTVYSESPEFFLVTIEYYDEFTVDVGEIVKTNHMHFVGRIVADKYYYCDGAYYGKSVYEALGYVGCKKYYVTPTRYCVKKDGALYMYHIIPSDEFPELRCHLESPTIIKSKRELKKLESTNFNPLLYISRTDMTKVVWMPGGKHYVIKEKS